MSKTLHLCAHNYNLLFRYSMCFYSCIPRTKWNLFFLPLYICVSFSRSLSAHVRLTHACVSRQLAARRFPSYVALHALNIVKNFTWGGKRKKKSRTSREQCSPQHQTPPDASSVSAARMASSSVLSSGRPVFICSTR